MPQLPGDNQHLGTAMSVLLRTDRPSRRRTIRRSNQQNQPGLQRRQLLKDHAGRPDSFRSADLLPLPAGIVGFVFIKYAVPVMTIRWWIKYGRLKTTDSDFRSARGTVILVSAISFIILVFLRVTLFGLRL
jgi:hypothetical protein